MANFAVIKDGRVENVIVCESKALAEEVTGLTCVEYTSENPVFVGLGYDGTTFEHPAQEEAPTE
jgi:hypothetical protein